MRIYINLPIGEKAYLSYEDLLEELQIAAKACNNLDCDLDELGFLETEEWNLFQDMKACLENLYRRVQKEKNGMQG